MIKSMGPIKYEIEQQIEEVRICSVLVCQLCLSETMYLL